METCLQNSKEAVDFCTRPLLKKIIMFTLPLILTSVLQLLYNAADLVVVGRWAGDAAMAAVGSTGALINLVTNLFIGLSVGALAAVARYLGARDTERVRRSVHTAVLTSVIGGFIVGAVGFFASRSMLELMDTPDAILPLSSLYLKIYFCGMPFNLLYNFGASILRACGDTKRPLVILLLAGFVNVALNILTVAVFKMSVAGVGIATTVSQAVSAAGVCAVLMRRKDAARLQLRALRLHKDALIDIVKIGLPAGIQGTVFSFSNVIIQSSVNGLDKLAVANGATEGSVVAGSSAAANIEGFIYVTMNAIAQACLTVAGQNYGAAKPENIDLALGQCLLLVTGVGAVLGAGVWLFGTQLLKIYGCSAEAVAYGQERMAVICTTYFLCGIMEVLVSALRAVGRSTMPMLVSVFGVVGVRVLWIYTVFRARRTLFVLFLSYPVSWIATLAVHLVCYLAARRKTFAELRAMRRDEDACTAPQPTYDGNMLREDDYVQSADDNTTPEINTDNTDRRQ